jgi:hypothetical protein
LAARRTDIPQGHPQDVIDSLNGNTRSPAEEPEVSGSAKPQGSEISAETWKTLWDDRTKACQNAFGQTDISTKVLEEREKLKTSGRVNLEEYRRLSKYFQSTSLGPLSSSGLQEQALYIANEDEWNRLQLHHNQDLTTRSRSGSSEVACKSYLRTVFSYISK